MLAAVVSSVLVNVPASHATDADLNLDQSNVSKSGGDTGAMTRMGLGARATDNMPYVDFNQAWNDEYTVKNARFYTIDFNLLTYY